MYVQTGGAMSLFSLSFLNVWIFFVLLLNLTNLICDITNSQVLKPSEHLHQQKQDRAAAFPVQSVMELKIDRISWRICE